MTRKHAATKAYKDALESSLGCSSSSITLFTPGSEQDRQVSLLKSLRRHTGRPKVTTPGGHPYRSSFRS